MRNEKSYLDEFIKDEVPTGFDECRSAIEQLRNEVIDIGTHLLAYIDEQKNKPLGDKTIMMDAKYTLDVLDMKFQLIKKRMNRHTLI